MEKQTISCPAACFVVSYGYTKDARFWYDFRMRGTHKEDKIVAQAITDYVKFLADARDAVYRVNCDSRTARQLEAEESQKEKELASLKKEVADTISRTVKARRDEIESGYDREIAKGQDRLKKARAKREKAKDKGVKERIAEETSQLRDHNRDLKIQLKTMFKKDRVPAFVNTTFFYALYYPRGMKEFGIGFLTFLICLTRTIISDEIEGSRREEMLALEEEIKELSAQLHSLEDSIRDQNIHITDTFGPYLGNEFLEPDRLSELSKLIQSGSAANITEAITLYKAGSQKKADGQ